MDDHKKNEELLEAAELREIWFWDGDFGHVLGCVEGREEQWLVERGVLHTESDDQPGVKELIEGDTVFRIRTARALEIDYDPREKLFNWKTVDPTTGIETTRRF